MSSDSINEIKDKLKQNPNDVKLIEEYAIALSDTGENQEALKNFIYLKKVSPDNRFKLYLCSVWSSIPTPPKFP